MSLPLILSCHSRLLYVYKSTAYLSMKCEIENFLSQKQEEAQSNSLVSTADIDSERVIKLVSDAVTAILTRLQSE